MMHSYISKEDYAHLILHFIGSEEYKNILKNMSYNNPEFEQGFMQGLVWSGILMNQCKEYVGEVNEDEISK